MAEDPHYDPLGKAVQSLTSFLDRAHASPMVQDVRIVLNPMPEGWRDTLVSVCKATTPGVACPPPDTDYWTPDRKLFLRVNSEDLFKYPMMSYMLRVAPLPGAVMWFDDDSYLTHTVTDFENWIRKVAGVMDIAHMAGQKFFIHLQGRQHLWYQSRAWYRKKPVIHQGHKITFCTGAWWTIRSEVLARYDWPDPDIQYCGGDVALGELCRQQGLLMRNWHTGVKVNDGPRRGKSRKNILVGYDYSD